MGYRRVDVNPFNSILSIVFLVAIFIGLYYLATGIFQILSFLTPVMLIAALVIDHRVVVNYGKWLVNTLRTNFLLGLGAILLMVFGYPIIAGYLLMKAFLSKKLQGVQSDFEEKSRKRYADFEEVETDPSEVEYEDLSEEKPLDLNAPKPEIKTRPRKNDDSEYDQFFQ
ncbi:MAG: hypothetical protein AB8F74_17020 [Saprospiraceae bacterium]